MTATDHQPSDEPPDAATAPLDYYTNAEAWKPSATTTLADLIDAIRSDEFAETVAHVRYLLADGHKADADARKKQLPAVSLSGTVTGRRKNAVAESRFEHSGLLQIDLDAKDNPGWTVAEMREALIDDKRMVAAFVTPSGQGVKGVARIPADASQHKAAFLAAEAHFRTLNLKIDPSCKDPVRLCFVSHDPNAWMREEPNAAMFEPVVLAVVDELDGMDDGDEEDDDDNTDRPAHRSGPASFVSPITGGLVLRANGHRDLDAATVREMLACIPPRPPYHEWLKIASAVWDALGEADGTAALCAWSPEERDGEYAAKFKHKLADVHAATLVMRAKEHGYEPTKQVKQAIKETIKAKTVAAILAESSKRPESQQFAPADVFYDAPAGKYLVKSGKSYFTFNKAGPVSTGIMRHLAPKYKNPSTLQTAVTSAIRNRELDGAVQWAGTIAGHRQGLQTDHNGLPILITSQANPPEPAAGECDTITSILCSAFENMTAFTIFMSWVSTRYRAVRSSVHIPAPMMVLAGEVNSGKSLLAWIVSQILGGRTANPYTAWSGGLLWNDDLVGSELLLVDDCIGSTDIRARRSFGAAFKEAIYPHVVQLRKRNVSALSVRPVWCVMVCCNDTTESLQIIPPLDADLADKVALLHVSPVTLPFDTSTPEGVKKLQGIIRSELPAFCDQLEKWEIPDEFKDRRSGVMAWRDPELADAVEAHSPARRMEDLLEAAIQNHGVWHDLPRDFTAAEIEARLLEHGSTVRDQARSLFSWHGACGSALSKLAKIGSKIVTVGTRDNVRGVRQYRITP